MLRDGRYLLRTATDIECRVQRIAKGWEQTARQMDDIAVLIFTLDWFIKNAPPEVVEEHMTRIAAHEDTLSKDIDSAGSLIASRASELRATLERIRSKRDQGGGL